MCDETTARVGGEVEEEERKTPRRRAVVGRQAKGGQRERERERSGVAVGAQTVPPFGSPKR